ncbi:hydroxymethylpyrimidine/phosphomethylpyrimidine kinase [Aestuariirhabdus sp. Z084]|uniref:bifunctional hydroxymethylpyrimidine kinase/phosphomethylpyrimidine kinase n=1 Tax=Aestuariirhabdus haliotis TaxID=2918751 RepID=UPI00201B3C31|nr:hydroxymethylpyrimidine/phosphomethylpyrimidine kinase [Aestuariirhabdus haliotis]MCL6415070.1 hydroxymethylpyrimidine/phosphomethylpyrimidine kinase [Aestuariirhabdus haliotis]MCL6419002.1 hydroxymethylpyrimidine/phosphomethylpyrimidine kinase [Aestuariirhabdus haliotis]
MPRPPVVVAISGLDPTGGAGIAADIEAITAMGGHCCPLISCQTVQDSHGVTRVEAVNSQLLIDQARVLLHDIKPDAFKLGALATAETVAAVRQILTPFPDVPVVMDPVLAGGGGGSLGGPALAAALCDLMPLIEICTPNIPELKTLAEACQEPDSVSDIDAVLQRGCGSLLLTGTHAASQQIHHRLYRANGEVQQYHCSRLPGEYHGSGCTLAAALAARRAQGDCLESACQAALDYCFDSLVNAYSLGKGQLFPDRLPRLRATKGSDE